MRANPVSVPVGFRAAKTVVYVNGGQSLLAPIKSMKGVEQGDRIRSTRQSDQDPIV